MTLVVNKRKGMIKNITIVIIAIILTGCGFKKNNVKDVSLKEAEKRILFICSNIDKVNGKKNGTFLSEIAIPFILFEEQNFKIDIVSPKGGQIPIYYKFDTTEIIDKALHSSYYLEKINSTLKPHEVNSLEYNAIVLPGGYGQFWDIHSNKEINELIAKIYENGGVIGSLGHGTSSLVNVKLSNGQPLVKDKKLTCFPSWFEREIMFEADYGRLLPFDMEKELEKNGANLMRVDKDTRSNSQIVDLENRIITASSATGGEFIAEEIIKIFKD